MARGVSLQASVNVWFNSTVLLFGITIDVRLKFGSNAVT